MPRFVLIALRPQFNILIECVNESELMNETNKILLKNKYKRKDERTNKSKKSLQTNYYALTIKQRILIVFAQFLFKLEVINIILFLLEIETVLGSFEIPDSFK